MVAQDPISAQGFEFLNAGRFGAENRIHDLNKRVIERKTFLSPMDSCLFDDRKIFHSVQPFRAADEKKIAYRDMLILLYQPLSESPNLKN
jgi:hypothetical protein